MLTGVPTACAHSPGWDVALLPPVFSGVQNGCYKLSSWPELMNETYLVKVAPAIPKIKVSQGDVHKKIKPLLEKWKGVFAKPQGVPPPRGIKHQIHMHPQYRPVARSAYRMSALELQEEQKQLTELVDLGFVQPSSSAFASLVLLIVKADGSWCMCVDDCGVNAATQKNSCS
eukprot:1158916-Pelagomonas_calceolata.AAC.2